MKKNHKILIVLSLALVFSLAAGFCVYQFLSPQRATIYVFRENYQAGTAITQDMFTPIQVDASIVVAGARAPASQRFITQNEFSTLLRTGDSLKLDVGAGTPLMMSLLSVTGGNTIEMSMQASAIAVTVQVNDTTGITNDLSPSSSVNVYVAYHAGGTSLLFEKMRVLAVHRGGSGGTLSGVTLEVTNDEALRLIDATRNGTIHLGLVNAGGYISVDGELPSTVPDEDIPESGIDSIVPPVSVPPEEPDVPEPDTDLPVDSGTEEPREDSGDDEGEADA